MAINHYNQGAHEKRVSPGLDCPPITPSDDTDLIKAAKALRVYNTTDDVAEIAFLTPGSGSTPRVWKLQPGVNIVPCVVLRVRDTGTDAGLEIHGIID